MHRGLLQLLFAKPAAPARPTRSPCLEIGVGAPPQGAAQHDGKKPHHMQRDHRGPKGERHQGQRGKYFNPHEHEAAAVRAGRMPSSQDMDQYQRNALARFEVFREAEDRRSCVDRVRSAEVSGSVKDGGVLREYTEQVPVRP